MDTDKKSYWIHCASPDLTEICHVISHSSSCANCEREKVIRVAKWPPSGCEFLNCLRLQLVKFIVASITAHAEEVKQIRKEGRKEGKGRQEDAPSARLTLCRLCRLSKVKTIFIYFPGRSRNNNNNHSEAKLRVAFHCGLTRHFAISMAYKLICAAGCVLHPHVN